MAFEKIYMTDEEISLKFNSRHFWNEGGFINIFPFIYIDQERDLFLINVGKAASGPDTDAQVLLYGWGPDLPVASYQDLMCRQQDFAQGERIPGQLYNFRLYVKDNMVDFQARWGKKEWKLEKAAIPPDFVKYMASLVEWIPAALACLEVHGAKTAVNVAEVILNEGHAGVQGLLTKSGKYYPITLWETLLMPSIEERVAFASQLMRNRKEAAV